MAFEGKIIQKEGDRKVTIGIIVFFYEILLSITTLPNALFLCCGPSKYNNGMFEKLCREIQFQSELPTFPCHVLSAHVTEECYDADDPIPIRKNGYSQ